MEEELVERRIDPITGELLLEEFAARPGQFLTSIRSHFADPMRTESEPQSEENAIRRDTPAVISDGTTLEERNEREGHVSRLRVVRRVHDYRLGIVAELFQCEPLLSSVNVDNLKTTKVTRSIIDDEVHCNVCYEDYFIDEEVCELPCKHHFHHHCITRWLEEEKTNCPLCRQRVQ